MLTKHLRAGVDVGGTFTDIITLDPASGEICAAKLPTDYADPVAPILAGLQMLDSQQQLDVVHHATTLSTNAILEGRLPQAALLTTAGFRDVLDIGRIQRPEQGIYDFNFDTPPALIARRYRLEAIERMGSRGEIVTPLDEAALLRLLGQISEDPSISTIAVSTLFSFINPAHEHRIGELIEQHLPQLHYSLSSDVAPEIREFERTSTVVLDALLKPILVPYLSRLEAAIAETGVSTTRIMMASGGLTSCAEAAGMPVNTINSGPSAGVLASANLGRQLGINNLITVDMGGTSLDIGVVENGHAMTRYDGDIAGYPLRIAAIDVAAVAAGGGSVALVDELGYIQVDRESAGSVPGPACYGRGGYRPTITDTDVVLGRLGTQFGGRGGLVLDADLAYNALADSIAAPLGIEVEEAASSVLDIIQARMTKAIASNTLEKGLDIRHLPLLVYGGAGPTHGVELADALGMNRVIVPLLAGNFSAIGLLLCPLRRDHSQMLLQPLVELGPERISRIINDLEREANYSMQGVDIQLTTRINAHMRYAGQGYDLAIPFERPWRGRMSNDDLKRLEADFHDLHERRYAYRSALETVELVQVRVSLSGPELDFPISPDPHIAQPGGVLERRPIYFTTQRRWHDADIYDRASIAAGDEISGPCRIEGDGSSTLIPPAWTATADRFLNLDIRRN